MRGTIKKNEAIGRRIERIMAEKLEGNVVGPEAGRSGPYDIENKCCLIEVKSSAKFTCDKTVKGKVYCHVGRFVVTEGSHLRLPVEAERMSKTPEYCWVIHDGKGDVVTFKQMSYREADQLLKDWGYSRMKGGMTLLSLRNDRVFTREEMEF